MPAQTNEQITAERIKKLAKNRGISASELLSRSALGVNTISNLSKGKDMLSRNLEKIADVLNCTTDYLLGRAAVPDRQIFLSELELSVLSAYRAHPEMQSAVNKLLGIEKTTDAKNIQTISEMHDRLTENTQDFAAFTSSEPDDYSDDTPDIL